MTQRNFNTNVTAEQATSAMFSNAEAVAMTRPTWRVTYWERFTLPSFSNWIVKVTFPNGLTVSVIGVGDDYEAAIQKDGHIQNDSIERFGSWSGVAEYINVVSETGANKMNTRISQWDAVTIEDIHSDGSREIAKVTILHTSGKTTMTVSESGLEDIYKEIVRIKKSGVHCNRCITGNMVHYSFHESSARA